MTQQTAVAPTKAYGVNHAKHLDYMSFKKEAIANQPLVVQYPLGSVDLGRNRTLKINGKIMPIRDSIYDVFLSQVLKVDPSFVSAFRAVTWKL
jgi:hypothetical protein